MNHLDIVRAQAFERGVWAGLAAGFAMSIGFFFLIHFGLRAWGF
jgi:hypothetical protein